MWIKRPYRNLVDSLGSHVNFLFRHEHIYIMDNHLCAAWVWMHQLDVTRTYNLFHIGHHYDLNGHPEAVQELLNQGTDLRTLDFEAFRSLKMTVSTPEEYTLPLFRWDNYIMNVKAAYPHFFGKTYFSTHGKGSSDNAFIDCEVDFHLLIDNIPYWINRDRGQRWILDLDLDYFFQEVGDRTVQVFSDAFILEIAHSIKRALHNIDALTICLSPDYCGGWKNALHVNSLICSVLGIDFNLKGEE